MNGRNASEAAGARLEHGGPGAWRLSGVLSFESVPGIYTQTRAALHEGGDLSVDLSGVTRTDSAGLALMVDWLAACRARGGRLHLSGVPEQLLAMARVSGLDRLLQPLDDAHGAGQ